MQGGQAGKVPRGPEPAVSRADLECVPGPCRFCRSGWQWWLWGEGWLRKVAPCPGLGLLPPPARTAKGGGRPQPFGGHSPSRKHHLGDSFWHIGDLAPAPSGSWQERQRPGLEATRTWAGGGPCGQARAPPLTCRSLSMWARHSSRSLSPGTTTVPSGTAGGQGGRQQLAAPQPGPRSSAPPPRPICHSQASLSCSLS